MAGGMEQFVARRSHKAPRGEITPVPLEAVVVTNGINSPLDDLFVVAPSFSGELQYGPCRWSPRVDASGVVVYPSRGDVALLILSDDNEPWALWYTDMSGAPPAMPMLAAGVEQNLFVQPTAPISPPSTYLWIQTGLGAGGSEFTMWIEDGAV
jgi:hypothetical protein